MTYEPCCLCVCCEVTPALPAFQETGCSCSPIIYKIPKLPTRPSENDREPQRTIGAGGRDHVCSHPALELTKHPLQCCASFPSPKEFAIVCKYSIPPIWALSSRLSSFRLSEHSYHRGRIHAQENEVYSSVVFIKYILGSR